MKRKHLVATGIVIAALGLAAPAAYAEEVTTEAATEVAAETETDAVAEDTADNALETSAEDTVEKTIEEDALTNQHLADISYEKGALSEEGWESKFLNMKFMPAEGIVMGMEENDTLQEYHNRNGEENAVAASEMVAVTEDGKSFVQVMVEVNPNKEEAEDILDRFTKNEKLEDPTEVRSVSIADKKFVSTTGELDGDHYFLAVSTDQDGVAIAIKMKYANAMKKRAFTKGFEILEEEAGLVEEAAEEGTENESEEGVTLDEKEAVQLPAEFEAMQDEVQTETEEAAE